MTDPTAVIQSLLNLTDASIKKMSEAERYAWGAKCAKIILNDDLPAETRHKIGKVYGKITEPLE